MKTHNELPSQMISQHILCPQQIEFNDAKEYDGSSILMHIELQTNIIRDEIVREDDQWYYLTYYKL